MLGLSKKTDYALMALTHLASQPGREAIRARVIAEAYGLPVELLAKVLQRLAKSGIVVATPGPTGGYLLSRDARTISVGEVLAIIEGTPAIIHCLSPTSSLCDQHERCTIRTPLTRLNSRLMDLLNATTLAELIQPDTRGPSAVRWIEQQPKLAAPAT